MCTVKPPSPSLLPSLPKRWLNSAVLMWRWVPESSSQASVVLVYLLLVFFSCTICSLSVFDFLIDQVCCTCLGSFVELFSHLIDQCMFCVWLLLFLSLSASFSFCCFFDLDLPCTSDSNDCCAALIKVCVSVCTLVCCSLRNLPRGIFLGASFLFIQHFARVTDLVSISDVFSCT